VNQVPIFFFFFFSCMWSFRPLFLQVSFFSPTVQVSPFRSMFKAYSSSSVCMSVYSFLSYWILFLLFLSLSSLVPHFFSALQYSDFKLALLTFSSFSWVLIETCPIFLVPFFRHHQPLRRTPNPPFPPLFPPSPSILSCS